ncbi:hypothetical protein, partial [Pseudarthrobacter albicanus]|uniref:hypothetical protein n=1 Tax=Pseudarthrobacter albicanus TaxID=2823873 RepID=UPI001BA9D23F
MVDVLRGTGPGPLAGCAAGFAGYLAGFGYAPGSVVLRLNLLKHLSRWLAAEAVDPSGFDAATVERFLADRRTDHTDMSSSGAVAPLFAYLRSLKVIPDGVALAREVGPVDGVLSRWGG